jgi:hypothetical protein
MMRCVIEMIVLQSGNGKSVKKAVLSAGKNALGTVCVGFTYFIIYLN